MSRRAHNSGDGSFARDAGTQTGKAVALVGVIVLVGILLLHHTGTTTKVAGGGGGPVAGHATTTVPATTTTTVVAPSTVKLQVLNGVLAGPLAGDWSKKLQEGAGYNTLAPDNATTKVASSQIYVLTAGYLPAAQQLAALIGLTPAAVVSTIPPPANAPIPPADKLNANVVLVIGPDLVAGATTPLTTSSTTSTTATPSG